MLLGALIGVGLPVDVLRKSIHEHIGPNWKLKLDEHVGLPAYGRCASIEVPSDPSEMSPGELLAQMSRMQLTSTAERRAREILQLMTGATDSIDNMQVTTGEWAETLCVLLGYEELSLHQSYRSAFCVGLEAPEAVLSLIEGHKIRMHPDQRVPLSPLGVSLMLTLAPAENDPPLFLLQRVGSGFHSLPPGLETGAVRLLIGLAETQACNERVYEVKATIDDMNPELYPPILSSLQKKGALDSWWTGSVTKDGRPGATITSLVPNELLPVIVEALFEETTTIGVRFHEVSRRILPRREYTMETSLGDVGVKESTLPNGNVVWKAELKDCVRLSELAGISVKKVRAIVDREIEEKRSRQ
jgi:uncharacterized protein (DUF111 family)